MASRLSASAAAARTHGNRIRTFTGARNRPGWAGDIRYAHGSEGVEKSGGVTVSDDDADGNIHGRNLQKPLGAVQMGLIYVNPEGPTATPIR